MLSPTDSCPRQCLAAAEAQGREHGWCVLSSSGAAAVVEWSREWWRELVAGENGELSGSLIRWDLVGHCKNFNFYSE